MKKIISVLLAVILAFSALYICTSAEGGTYQTYQVICDIRDDTISVVPVDGYDFYVLPGEDFKFTVETAEGYSDSFIMVQLDTTDIEPDVHGVYTIEDINSDLTIRVFLSMDEGSSNLFSSLIVFVHNILDWIVNIFNQLFKSSAT